MLLLHPLCLVPVEIEFRGRKAVPSMEGAVYMGDELRFFSWSLSGVVKSKSFSSRPGGILSDETLVAVVSGLVDLATELTHFVDLRTTLADDRTIHVVGRHEDLLRQRLAGLNIAWNMSTLGMSMILRDLGSKERTNGCMKRSAVCDRSCSRVTALSRSAQLSAPPPGVSVFSLARRSALSPSSSHPVSQLDQPACPWAVPLSRTSSRLPDRACCRALSRGEKGHSRASTIAEGGMTSETCVNRRCQLSSPNTGHAV
jgi:hypothetical protein